MIVNVLFEQSFNFIVLAMVEVSQNSTNIMSTFQLSTYSNYSTFSLTTGMSGFFVLLALHKLYL